MSEALGKYLYTLRINQDLSRETVAQQLGVSSRQVVNWEQGINTPGSQALAKFLHAVGGRFEDAGKLLLNEKATAEDGQRLAKERIEQNKERDIEPVTAIGGFLHGLGEIAHSKAQKDYEAGYEDDPTRELTDDYISRIDTGKVNLTKVGLLLSDLEVPAEVIAFLLNTSDLPVRIGYQLALTRIGIGSAEEIMGNYKKQ